MLLLAIAGEVTAISLTPLWTFSIGNDVKGLAFSDNGYLGVASSDYCAYILDQNGNLVSKRCGGWRMNDASFCCGRFGFVNGDGYAYIYDLSTGTWKEVHVGYDYDDGITMLEDGFLAGCCALAYFDFLGNKRWIIYMEYISNGPAVYKDYVYVPRRDWPFDGQGALTILRLSDGSEVRTIKFSEDVWDAQVCGHYLALGTAQHVYLHDISDPMNPKLLRSYDKIATSCRRGGCSGAYNVAFSPDCKYLVSADYNDWKIHIFEVATGRQVLERKFEDRVHSVAWWKDRIAVGLYNGKVYVFKVEGYIPFKPSPYKEIPDSVWKSLTQTQKDFINFCTAYLNPKRCLELSKSVTPNNYPLIKQCTKLTNNVTSCVNLSNELGTKLKPYLACYKALKDPKLCKEIAIKLNETEVPKAIACFQKGCASCAPIFQKLGLVKPIIVNNTVTQTVTTTTTKTVTSTVTSYRTVTRYNVVTSYVTTTTTVTQTVTQSLAPTVSVPNAQEILKLYESLKSQIAKDLAQALVRQGLPEDCAKAIAEKVVDNLEEALLGKLYLPLKVIENVAGCTNAQCFAQGIINSIEEGILPLSPQDVAELGACGKELLTVARTVAPSLAPSTTTVYLVGTTTVTKTVTQQTVVTQTVTVTQPATEVQTITKPETVTVTITKPVLALRPSNETLVVGNHIWEVRGEHELLRAFDYRQGVLLLTNATLNGTVNAPVGSMLELMVEPIGNANLTIAIGNWSTNITLRKGWQIIDLTLNSTELSIKVNGIVAIDYIKALTPYGTAFNEDFLPSQAVLDQLQRYYGNYLNAMDYIRLKLFESYLQKFKNVTCAMELANNVTKALEKALANGNITLAELMPGGSLEEVAKAVNVLIREGKIAVEVRCR